MSRKEQNLTGAAVIMLMSTVIVKIIGALFKIPLSSDYILGDLGFGYFSAVYDLYIPVYTLALSGFPVAIARMVAQYTADRYFKAADRVFKVSLKVLLFTGFAGFLIMSLISVPLVKFGITDRGAAYSLLAIAPAVLFCLAASVYRGYFEGLKNMIPTAISSIIESMGKFIFGLTAAVVVMKIYKNPAAAAAAAMAGITLGTFFSLCYLFIFYRKTPTVLSAGNSHEDADLSDSHIMKTLIRISVPVAAASLSVSFTSLIDTLTLRRQLFSLLADNPDNALIMLEGTVYSGIDYREIPTLLYGIRGKAHTLFNLIPTLTAALGVGAVPIITDNFVKKDTAGLKKNADLVVKFSSVIAFPAAAGFVVLGRQIMELLYGESSSVLGGRILNVYGIAALFAGLTVPMTSLLQAMGKYTQALYNIAAGMLFKLILNVYLTRIIEINIMGSSAATALCYLLIFCLHLAILARNVGIRPDIKNCFVKPGIAAIICAGAAFALETVTDAKYSVILSVMMAAAVYFAALILMKTVKKEEISGILNK